MPHFFERTALILLAGTALTACASSPRYPVQPPLVQLPPPAAPARAAPARALAAAPPAPAPQPQPVEVAEAPPVLPPAPTIAVAAASEPPRLAFTAPGEDAFARSRAPAATYKVRRGDTLAGIANRLDTTVEALAKANDLRPPYRLQPGQTLKNPKAPKPRNARTSSRTSDAGDGGTYTVRRGDTLFGIAQRLGVTVEALRAANGMGRSSALMAGRKLKLPGGADEPEAAAAPDEDTALAERMARAAEPRSQAEDPAPPASSADRGATRQQVTGRVVTIDVPGKSYRVKKGDNLERVANRLDSSVSELARINKLKKPYRLQPGQTIRGPGSSAKAYVTVRGDTLGEVARRFSVTEAELRSANGLRRGASIGAGRRLRLPADYRDRGPLTVRAPETPRTPPPSASETPPSRPAPQPPEAALPDRPQPYRPTPGTTPYPRTGPVPGAPVASPPVSDAQITEMGRNLFVWPLQGQVISGFGGRGQGPRNDGLNIRANAGDAVRAAASGDVVYAGDQVPGFGNLVLIKHADGWVTAYGHLGRVNVRMQQKVTQGQTIGEAGTTGGVSEPQLHFEVRYAPTPQERARPVDPTLVLPK